MIFPVQTEDGNLLTSGADLPLRGMTVVLLSVCEGPRHRSPLPLISLTGPETLSLLKLNKVASARDAFAVNLLCLWTQGVFSAGDRSGEQRDQAVLPWGRLALPQLLRRLFRSPSTPGRHLEAPWHEDKVVKRQLHASSPMWLRSVAQIFGVRMGTVRPLACTCRTMCASLPSSTGALQLLCLQHCPAQGLPSLWLICYF